MTWNCKLECTNDPMLNRIRHYIQDCHVQKVTVHAGVLLSDATALSSPQSPDVVLGERVLRILISCPEGHRIPSTRSVFMFGTIEDTPNIIRTGCKQTCSDEGNGLATIKYKHVMQNVYFSANRRFCLQVKILFGLMSLILHISENLSPKFLSGSGTRISGLSEQINVAENGSRTFCPD